MVKNKMVTRIKVLVLTLLGLVYMIPVVMMVLGSLKDKGEAMRFDLALPKVLLWENYAYIFDNGNVLLGYFNSTVITGGATTFTLLFGALAGIYVGRQNGRFSNAIYHYFILGLTLTFQTATTFALLRSLNIYGSRLGVVLIFTGMHLPFTVMTFSSFTKGIPREIDEAGLIDGCGPLRLIFKILLPIMKPIFITNLIVTAIGVWNNFMIPLFYLGSSKKQPIPLMVYSFYGRFARNWNYVFAMLVITIAPIVILYLFLQKYIVEGMTGGAVKG